MMRSPPNNPEAETHLLGCCLMDGARVVPMALVAGITSQSFFEGRRGMLFGLLIEMVAGGTPISDATVFQELMRRGTLEAIGGHAEFAAISASVPTSAEAAQLVGIVAELAAVRRVIKIAASMAETAYGYAGGGVPELIGSPINGLLALANADGQAEPSWGETIDSALTTAEEIIASNGEPLKATISFPWPKMDALFGPMQRGQLVVIASRTSIGKSSLARPIACHAAKHGHRVYFDTLEVSPERVALQMAAMISRVGVRQLGGAPADGQLDFKRALSDLRTAGIVISRKDRSLAQIGGRMRALAAQGKLDMAIIDHGGYVDEVAKARSGEKVGAIGVVTKALKNLAVDLNIPVVLLWQLNRGSEKEQNREPVLSDLKDSGSVEEDADKVIFIHRPSSDPLTGREQSAVDTVEDCPRFFQNVIQAKGRDDGTTLMSFYLNRRTASFDPIQK